MQEYIDLDRLLPAINKKSSELSFALESDHYSLGDTLQSVEDSKAERSPFLLKDDSKEENSHPFNEFSAIVCKSARELKMALSAGNPNINISTLVHKYSINANLETQAESEKYGFSIVTKIQCLTKVLTLKDTAYSPEALQLIEKNDWPTFYNRYGDYYASQVFKGSLLKLTIKVASSSKHVEVDDFVNFSATSTGKTPIFPASLKGYLHKLSEKYSLEYSLERIGGPSFDGSGPTPEGVHPTTIPTTPSLPTPSLPTPSVPLPHPHPPGSPTTTPPSTAPSTLPSNGNSSTSSTSVSSTVDTNGSSTGSTPSDTAAAPTTTPSPTGTTPAPSLHHPHHTHPAPAPKPLPHNNNNAKPKPAETVTGVVDKDKGQKDMENLLEYCTQFCINTNASNETNIRAIFSSYRIPGLSQELFPKKKNYDDVCEEVYDYITVQHALMNAKSQISITEKALEADAYLLQINEVVRALKGIYDTIGPWGCQPLAAVRDQLKADLKDRYKTPQDWEATINKFVLDLKFNGLKNKSHFCLKYLGSNKDDKGEGLYIGPACPTDFEFWELDKQIQHKDDRWAPTVRYDDETNLTVFLVGEPGNEVKFIEDGSRVYICTIEASVGQHNHLSSNGVWDDDRQADESKWTIHTTGEKKTAVQFGDVISITNHKKEYLSPGKNIHGVHKLDLSPKAHYWAVCKPRTLPRDHSKI